MTDEAQNNNEPDFDPELEAVGLQYDVTAPYVRNFLPWHHPRKHYVRSHQWAEILEAHLDQWPITGRPLKYLGLPGDDLLDLRYFVERVCTARDISIRFLGLNENVKAESDRKYIIDTALDEIRKSAFVDPASEIILDTFTEIARRKSIAFDRLHTLGHCDVVNLDLCDGMALHQPGTPNSSYYDAVQLLFGEQFRSRTPWLFFLTSRIGVDHCHIQILETFNQLIDRNLTNCDGFRAIIDEICEGKFGVATDPSDIMVRNLCGLLKWLGGLCVESGGWKMETWRVDSYTVQPNHPIEDMFSVALRFVPIVSPAADPAGIGSAEPKADNECRIAKESANKILRRRNVDNILADDSELLNTIASEKAILLRQAGFKVEQYMSKCQEWGLRVTLGEII